MLSRDHIELTVVVLALASLHLPPIAEHQFLRIVLACFVALVLLWSCRKDLRSQQATLQVKPRGSVSGSFLLGEEDAPILKVPDSELPWLEEKVAFIYAVFDEKAPRRSINLQPALLSLRDLQARGNLARRETQMLHEPFDDALFCRLLIAQDFDVSRSAALAEHYVGFRRELCGGVVPPPSWVQSGVVMIPFEDRLGRPVVVIRLRYLDKKMPMELLERGYRATLDVLIAHMLHARSGEVSRSNPLEQYITVIEVEGAGRKNFSVDFVKIMVRESNTNYPDRLAQIFVLGVGSMMRTIYGIVAPMLHPRTVKKVQLIPRNNVPSKMQQLVDPKYLPAAYGGQASPFSDPTEAKSLEDLAGRIAANTWQRLGIAPATVAAGDTTHDSAASKANFGHVQDDRPRCFACCGIS